MLKLIYSFFAAPFAWKHVATKGANEYWINTVTGERQARCWHGYSPLDRTWLDTGEWNKDKPSPPTRRPTPTRYIAK